MKKTSVLLLSLFGILTWAQSIEGKITDQHKKSVSYAEVVLSQDDKKIAAITSEGGTYDIQVPKNGSYLLEIFRDDQKIHSEQIDINGAITKNILTEIKVPVEKQIDGVSLVAPKKKLIERKVDRLVFNVENSVASQGLDAVEALSKTPMLRATDEAITIAGKSGVAVMINDRLLNLSGQELINYLKSIRSDDIAKIEVITTPPSKYAAEGKSGLINIILKKNTSLGFNGSLQTSGNYSEVASWRDGTTLNYQGPKLSITANGGIGENIWKQKSYNHSIGADNFWNIDTEYFGKYRYKNSNIKAEYKINDNNVIGFSYNYSFSNPYNTNTSVNEVSNINGYKKFDSDNYNLNHNNGHYATAFYDVKLDSLGSKLSLSANLMSNKTNANNRFRTLSDTYNESLNINNNQYQIYSGQADLEQNFGKIKTEAGVKYSDIKNDSYSNLLTLVGESNDVDKQNNFDYNEKNYAAYVSTNFKINEKLDAKLGLRYEYTQASGTSPQENITNNYSYGKFFPTAYLSYKPNENDAYSINYSRRIRRPYFGNLNPGKTYSSLFDYYRGNPFLKPSFTDNLELNYILKNNFTTTLYYSYTQNSMDRIQRIETENGNNIKYASTENTYNETQMGLSMNYNFNKLRWLESNVVARGYYSESNTDRTDISVNAPSLTANMNFDNSFFLKKDKSVVFLLGYWIDLPNKSGYSQIKLNHFTYAGIKLSFLEKKLMINAYLNDVFNTQAYQGKEVYKDFTSNFRYKGLSQNVQVSVTYKFGNNNVKGATKQNKFDEQSRVGGAN